MYLLDNDLVFRVLRGEERILEALTKLDQQSFGVTGFTLLEVIVAGRKKMVSHRKLKQYLNYFQCVDMSREILLEVWKLKSLVAARRVELADLVDLATAKRHKCMLLTLRSKIKNFRGVAVWQLTPSP